MNELELTTDRDEIQDAPPSGVASTDRQPGTPSPVDEPAPFPTAKSPWRPTALLKSAAYREA